MMHLENAWALMRYSLQAFRGRRVARFAFWRFDYCAGIHDDMLIVEIVR